MEQQKILWIIFSVTLFLLVVVVVGFVWFLPDEDDPADRPQVVSGPEESAINLDPIVWVRDDEKVPGIQDEPSGEAAEEEQKGDLLLVYGETAEPETVVSAETGTVIEVVETPITATVQVRAPVEVRAPLVAEVRRTSASARTQTSAVVTPTPPAQPRTVKVTYYWIQAGSYKSQSRAEETQESLASKGWNSRISSREVSGENFFRVRLGPYETEAEAKKFLGWLHDVDTFESSYISQVYATRTIN